MKQYLQLKYKILLANNLQFNSDEKYQTHIDKMIKKISLYYTSKQVKLKKVTTE